MNPAYLVFLTQLSKFMRLLCTMICSTLNFLKIFIGTSYHKKFLWAISNNLFGASDEVLPKKFNLCGSKVTYNSSFIETTVTTELKLFRKFYISTQFFYISTYFTFQHILLLLFNTVYFSTSWFLHFNTLLHFNTGVEM